jgi:hypothetical protein
VSPDPLLNANTITNAFASNRDDTLASRRSVADESRVLLAEAHIVPRHSRALRPAWSAAGDSRIRPDSQ